MYNIIIKFFFFFFILFFNWLRINWNTRIIIFHIIFLSKTTSLLYNLESIYSKVILNFEFFFSIKLTFKFNFYFLHFHLFLILSKALVGVSDKKFYNGLIGVINFWFGVFAFGFTCIVIFIFLFFNFLNIFLKIKEK